MFTIGDFAKLGRVSVRMLRHYDAIGLLRPATVDAATGYRFYDAGQLRRLNRLIALKDLGFTLEQVQVLLSEKLGPDEMRGMLRLRRAQLEAQLAADTARLMSVEARLRMIEKEGHMDTGEVILKRVEPVRIAELSGVAAGYAPQDIGPVINPLYGELMSRLGAAGVTPAGPAIAYYEQADGTDPDAVLVHAGLTVSAPPGGGYEFEVTDLPAVPEAATLIHHGSMDDVMGSIQLLASWIEENGYRTVGYHREVYLDYDPMDSANGVTELQIEVTR